MKRPLLDPLDPAHQWAELEHHELPGGLAAVYVTGSKAVEVVRARIAQRQPEQEPGGKRRQRVKPRPRPERRGGAA